jgi:3-phenylpropionate/trans-cinnamate dioxygenase ferredoxin reductase subunit
MPINECHASYDVLIVGAGHAGALTAIALRDQGFDGSIALVGEEPELPYERPPLSKEYLAGQVEFDKILIRPAEFWRDRGVTLLPGVRVASLTAQDRHVVTESGDRLGYGKLVWATGGHARRLDCAGADLAGVHTVRTRADVQAVMAELGTVQRVAVIGGGFIGLEAAAVLTKLGKQVTVLEAQDHVLARVAGEPLSLFFEAEHRAHGVDIRLGTAVDHIEGEGGRVAAVRLDDGLRIATDMVIVGIGIIPAVDALIAAGADGGNGVHVDDYCRTSLAHVFAAGDCALHANAFADNAPIRLESIANAREMATVVAKAIAGEPTVHHALPWFWSNQFDLRLQTAGLSLNRDEMIVRGTPENRSFSLLYLKSGRVIAIDCVNAPKDYVGGRALILSGKCLPAAVLADTSVALKTLAA